MRTLEGHAIGIKPGTALVENADGTFYLLEDDYSKYRFELAHAASDAPVDAPADSTKKTKGA
jgi:hypothetical protein